MSTDLFIFFWASWDFKGRVVLQIQDGGRCAYWIFRLNANKFGLSGYKSADCKPEIELGYDSGVFSETVSSSSSATDWDLYVITIGRWAVDLLIIIDYWQHDVCLCTQLMKSVGNENVNSLLEAQLTDTVNKIDSSTDTWVVHNVYLSQSISNYCSAMATIYAAYAYNQLKITLLKTHLFGDHGALWRF